MGVVVLAQGFTVELGVARFVAQVPLDETDAGG